MLLTLLLAWAAALEEIDGYTGLFTSSSAGSSDAPINYYVQLIRGDDQDEAPRAGARPVGPKLARDIRAAFRMKNFWEIDRHLLSIPVGRQGQVALSGGRAVSIDLSEAGKRKVAVFRDGTLWERAIRPRGNQMTIIGGQEKATDAWFVVVRRDEPP